MVIADLVDTLSRIGAIGGILSIIGVGLLILLVASQNRQIRSMREWIEEEPQRQQETAQRVIAEVQRRIAAARDRRAAAAGAPAAAAAAGGSRPLPAAPGTLGATPEAQKIAAGKEIVPPGPATPEIPVPGAPTPADGAPKFAPLTPAGGADAEGSVPPPAPAEDAPAVVSEFLNQETQAADALPEPDPVPAAAGNPADVRFSEELYDLEEEEPAGGSRVLFGVGVVALLAGIVIAGFVLFGGGGDEEPVGGNTPEQTDEGGGDGDATETTPSEPTVDPSSINVRVFNGTTVSGLAQRVTDQLKADGFGTDRPDTFTSNQTVADTKVAFRPGQKASALAVAEALGLSESAVEAIAEDLSVAAGETAEVVVLTGADLENSASGTTAE